MPGALPAELPHHKWVWRDSNPQPSGYEPRAQPLSFRPYFYFWLALALPLKNRLNISTIKKTILNLSLILNKLAINIINPVSIKVPNKTKTIANKIIPIILDITITTLSLIKSENSFFLITH